MPIRTFQAGRLDVRVFRGRARLGAAAAAEAGATLAAVLPRSATARVVFAAAPSQNEFLAGLRAGAGIDWSRVVAFHLDEYAGLAASNEASFRRFLRDRILGRVPVKAFHQIQGDAYDLEAECERYAALLSEAPPDAAFLGIGENGHLAFIDPPVCDFADPRAVRVVELDPVCRMQQVHDGAFARLGDVPARAISMTVPAILRAARILVMVPGPAKARAVRDAIEGPITEECPASVLRTHPDATLFLDEDSASLLTR